jgi:hypothetical protein
MLMRGTMTHQPFSAFLAIKRLLSLSFNAPLLALRRLKELSISFETLKLSKKRGKFNPRF